MNKIKLTISEFSKLCSVTIKTLRHYEKVGILIPHQVDEWTHYRYYCVEQMEQMQKIKDLKNVGLSLEEIRQMQDDETFTLNPIDLKDRIEQTYKQIYNLKERLRYLQAMQNPPQKTKVMNKITIKPLPSGVVASWRTILNGYSFPLH